MIFVLAGMGALYALIGIVIGGVLIGFGVHFVPVGGAPAAMGQAPGIATGVAMLAAGAGLAGLFGGAWAAEQGLVVATVTGAVGGGLMMAITCLMVNVIYVFGMGIPAASGKVTKDPLTGDTQAEYKSQGTEGHGLPFISFVGGVIGGALRRRRRHADLPRAARRLRTVPADGLQHDRRSRSCPSRSRSPGSSRSACSS